MRRILDASGNVVSEFHYDETEDRTTIRRVQDCEPIVDHNKRLQSLNDGYNPDRSLKRIASIPLVVAEKWMNEDGINWMALPKHEKRKYLARKLNDPQWRHLRTSAGRF